jgi:glycosyltransferase involved in cell wall biosynthesis
MGQVMLKIPAEVVMTPAAAELHDARSMLAPSSYEAPLDLSIFVSCYNEEPYIVATLETIRAALEELGGVRYEIIVIDDCSYDCSADLVEDYIRMHSAERILLRRNKVNRGWAQNYYDAAFIGKGKYYRTMCGDNAEPKDTVVAVLRELGKADMLIPYYAMSEGRSLYRRFLSAAFVMLVNVITGNRLRYYNGLAVHLRYNVMRWHSHTRGFGFQADLISMLIDQGFTYQEVPVRTVERKGALSTAISFKNILSVAHTLTDLVLRRIANRVYRESDY